MKELYAAKTITALLHFEKLPSGRIKINNTELNQKEFDNQFKCIVYKGKLLAYEIPQTIRCASYKKNGIKTYKCNMRQNPMPTKSEFTINEVLQEGSEEYNSFEKNYIFARSIKELTTKYNSLLKELKYESPKEKAWTILNEIDFDKEKSDETEELIPLEKINWSKVDEANECQLYSSEKDNAFTLS